MKHKHHIVPKHAGGTDDPENLIELSIEEHAEAHRKLWEQYNRWEDYIAWQGLAKLKSDEEWLKEMLHHAGVKSLQCRPSNKGKKYNWKKPQKPVGTGGTRWFHNPENPTEKCCISSDQEPPTGWVRGQGKKSKNPGLNFHAKRLEISSWAGN